MNDNMLAIAGKFYEAKWNVNTFGNIYRIVNGKLTVVGSVDKYGDRMHKTISKR